MDIDDLDMFFDAYIEAALWSSTNPDYGHKPDAPENMDDVDAEIDPATLVRLKRECAEFIEGNAADLADMDPAQAGHDFWLTRCGHGCGFWDRGIGAIGDRLTKACKPYGNVDVYQGDDGLIYFSGFERD